MRTFTSKQFAQWAEGHMLRQHGLVMGGEISPERGKSSKAGDRERGWESHKLASGGLTAIPVD